MNSSAKHLTVILAVTVASLFLVPSIIHGLATRSPMAQRRARIATMSDAENSRLEVNFDKFRQLKSENPAELTRLQNIHDELQKHPELIETAVQYREWLNSLESWQQDVIREIPEPEKRYQYVSRMLDRKFIRFEPKWGALVDAFPDGIQVPMEDVEAMSQHLKAEISKFPRVDLPEEFKQIESLPERQRDDKRDELKKKLEQRVKEFDQLMTTTVDLISDRKVATRVNQDPWQKGSIVLALLREYEKRKSPETDFQTVFDNLSPERQDAIMQMTPEAAQIELRRKERQTKDDAYYHFLSGGWMRRPGLDFRGNRFSRGRNGRAGGMSPGGPNRRPGGERGNGSEFRTGGERGKGGDRGANGPGPREKNGRPQRPGLDGK